MSESICDVKRIELLISQIQKAQNGDVVLIASAKTAEMMPHTNNALF